MRVRSEQRGDGEVDGEGSGADDRGDDPGQGASERAVVAQRSMKGAPTKTNTKLGTKVTQVTSNDATTPAVHGESRGGVSMGAEERDELDHHDQRPRRGLGQRQAADHVARGHPAVGLDGLLGDEREHGVRTPKVTGAVPAKNSPWLVFAPRPGEHRGGGDRDGPDDDSQRASGRPVPSTPGLGVLGIVRDERRRLAAPLRAVTRRR